LLRLDNVRDRNYKSLSGIVFEKSILQNSKIAEYSEKFSRLEANYIEHGFLLSPRFAEDFIKLGGKDGAGKLLNVGPHTLHFQHHIYFLCGVNPFSKAVVGPRMRHAGGGQGESFFRFKSQ